MIDIPDFLLPKDASGNTLCPRCGKLTENCDCPVIEKKKPKINRPKPHFRLEKGGRKGKTVTLIVGLLPQEKYLKDLAKQLKTKTGSGGTFYIEDAVGIIELQGDHLQMVKALDLW